MKTIIILLCAFSSFAQVRAPDTTYCMPIAHARIVLSQALRVPALDALVGEQSKRIALDSSRMIEMSSQYTDEIRIERAVTESIRKQLDDERKLKESFREEAESLRKPQKFWPRLWRGVKIGGAIVAAGFIGYEIGDKL